MSDKRIDEIMDARAERTNRPADWPPGYHPSNAARNPPVRRRSHDWLSKTYINEPTIHQPVEDTNNPYCSGEMRDRLNKQYRMRMKTGERVMEQAKAMFSPMSPDAVRRIIKRTWCDVCDRWIDDLVIEHYRTNRWYKFKIRCHGMPQVFEVTKAEWTWISMQNKIAVAFLNPEKQAFRDELLARVFTPPKNFLLENRARTRWNKLLTSHALSHSMHQPIEI